MINFNEGLPYIQVTNNASCGVAFAVSYMSQGVPIYAYSKVFNPGEDRKINIASDATNLKFIAYVYQPPYRLIPIYTTTFCTPSSKCFLINGELETAYIVRVPCCNNECCCCNCCCNCC